MPVTAHLVRAHTLCPLCNIACAPICAQMTAKSHVCGGGDVRPLKGQGILAERKFALNAMSRSPFSDENATRKSIVCVTCFICTGGTVALDVRMFRHRRSTLIGSIGRTEATQSHLIGCRASVRERMTRSQGCNGSLLGMQCPKQMNDNSDCCSFALDGSPKPSRTDGLRKAAPPIVVQYCNRRPAQKRFSKAFPIACEFAGIPGLIPFNHTYS